MSKWISRSINLGPTLMHGQIREHRLFGDLPESLGGRDTAMEPSEGLLIALGNCMGMVIAAACEARGVPYLGMILHVEAEVIEGEYRLDNFRLKVHMPGPVDDRTRRAVAAGERLCKVHNTLRHGADVQVQLAE
ncbi:MAG: OsmC family protein [Bacteroidota bacterium]